MSNTYTLLHLHTMFSLLDGFSTPKEYLQRCSELGIKSMAVTEHGNQLSWLCFAKLKKEFPDIKMLYGVEMYETEDLSIQDKNLKYYHLVVIAKNENGRRALNDLVTTSNIEGFYYKPRITIKHMNEHADDLIVLSACLGSKIAREGSFEKCLEYVNEYKSILPNFYLEMQSHDNKDQEEYNKKILKLSELTNTPFVITTDAHAATEEELKYQGYHVQIAQDRETMDEMYSGCYVQSVEEIHAIMDKQIGFDNVVKGLDETNKIAEMCDYVEMPFQKPKLPHFTLPDGFSSNKEYLRHLCEDGWLKKEIDFMTDEDVKIRKERLDYELDIISSMDFDGYFLILWDALNFARENNIDVGDGRGSAAGSFACFLLGITNLDPIKYRLIFERFLNPSRLSMPDIDIDVEDRDTVINYLMSKYGSDKVCQIMNLSYITPVVAIKDVASKILKIPYFIADGISKRFSYSTFEECLENNPNIYEEYPEYNEWFDIASKLSGRVRHTSVHAGGVGIVDGKMNEYIGLKLGSKGEHVIQADKRAVEEIGVVKYDLLGVKTLNIVKDARIEAGLSEWDLDINNPVFENDSKAYDIICEGNTDLVFQMESSGMKELTMKAKPRNIEELSAVIALYRPDSMPYIPDYLKGKFNPNDITYIHEDMKDILGKTYGALIYQEQILDIVRKFGGRSYGQADLYRKAIGSKNKDLIREESIKLEQEILENGYDEKIAKEISRMLSEMGGYCFNKSHSVSYSSLCLKTAYLKAHYPVEFYKASFNIIDKSDLSRYIFDANKNGVEIVPPNINKSEMNFSIQDGKIVFGFSSIKGLGDVVAQQILEERKANGNFKNFKDFLDRVKPSDSLVITLIKAGAFPAKDKRNFIKKYLELGFEFNFKPVKTLPTKTDLINKWRINPDDYSSKEERLEVYNQRKLEKEKVDFELKKEKKLQESYDKYLQNEDVWEFETLSTFITNNPFKEIYRELRRFDELEEGMDGVIVGIISNITKKKDRNKNTHAYIEVFSAFGIEEVTCWSSQFKKYQDMVKKQQKVAVLCKKKDGKGVVKEMKTYDQWIKDRSGFS